MKLPIYHNSYLTSGKMIKESTIHQNISHKSDCLLQHYFNLKMKFTKKKLDKCQGITF